MRQVESDLTTKPIFQQRYFTPADLADEAGCSAATARGVSLGSAVHWRRARDGLGGQGAGAWRIVATGITARGAKAGHARNVEQTNAR